MGGGEGVRSGGWGEAYVVSVDAPRESFLRTKEWARLANETGLLPMVLDVLGDGSWYWPFRLGKILARPILRSQLRYMAVASLPSPKKMKMVKPKAIRIQRSKMTDPPVGILMICHQEGPWISFQL